MTKKRSIVRIQNDELYNDELCLARANAKVDKDDRYKPIVDHQGTMQTRLARELHQKAGVPIGPCGLDEVKQFQIYMIEYQYRLQRTAKRPHLHRSRE